MLLPPSFNQTPLPYMISPYIIPPQYGWNYNTETNTGPAIPTQVQASNPVTGEHNSELNNEIRRMFRPSSQPQPAPLTSASPSAFDPLTALNSRNRQTRPDRQRSGRVGRPQAAITVTVILVQEGSLNSVATRRNGPMRQALINNGSIKENIEFSPSQTPEEIDAKMKELFPQLIPSGWMLMRIVTTTAFQLERVEPSGTLYNFNEIKR